MTIPSRHIHFWATFLWGLLFSIHGLSQNNLEYLTIEDGLSQGFISKILQDNEGFLWFGTQNGLNRYDGHGFEVFTHHPLDSFSIQGNTTRGIIETGDFLIVGTSGTSLNVFNKKTKRFFPLLAKGELKDRLAQGRMPKSILDKNGFLWVQINLPREKSLIGKLEIELFQDKPALIKTGQFWEVKNPSNFYYDEEKEQIICLNDKHGLIQIDVNSEVIESFDLPESFLNEDFGMHFFRGWFFHPSGFGRLEKEGWRWHETDFEIQKILFDEAKKMINIATVSGALLQYEIPESNTKKIFRKDGLLICKLENQRINDVFEDKSKVLWLGTLGAGIVKMKPNLRPFKQVVENLSLKTPIFIDGKGRYSFHANYF